MPPFCSNKLKKGSFSPFIWLMLFDIQQTASKNWHNGILTHTYRERQTEREGETGTAKISVLAYESYICVSVLCLRCVQRFAVRGTVECGVIFYSGLNMVVYESQWAKGDVPQESAAHTYYPCQHLPDKRAFVEERHSSVNQAYAQLFWHQGHVIHAFLSQWLELSTVLRCWNSSGDACSFGMVGFIRFFFHQHCMLKELFSRPIFKKIKQ